MTSDQEDIAKASSSDVSPPTTPEPLATDNQNVEPSRQPRRLQPTDDRKRKRGLSQDRRVAAGFGDGIERAICASFVHVGPLTFPVQHRPGIAASRPTEVARRENAVLLCDRNHEGDCVWPDGAFASDETPAPISAATEDNEITDEVSREDFEAREQLVGGPMPDIGEGEPAEQTTGDEPATSGSNEDWNSSGIADEDR